MNRYSPHPVTWTPEKIARFWRDYPTPERSFARAVGRYVVATYLPPLKGLDVLDYGAGREDLRPIVEAAGGRYHAFEPPGDPPEGPFDVVVALDVLEHVAKPRRLFEAVAALVKPGGTVLVTCPREERLEDSTVLCPDCGATYHRNQHLRSIAQPDLKPWLGGGMLSGPVGGIEWEIVRLPLRRLTWREWLADHVVRGGGGGAGDVARGPGTGWT